MYLIAAAIAFCVEVCSQEVRATTRSTLYQFMKMVNDSGGICEVMAEFH